MKKLMSLLLAVAMIFTLVVPVSAVDGEVADTITVWSDNANSWVSAKYIYGDNTNYVEGTLGTYISKESQWNANIDITELVKASGAPDITKVTGVTVTLEAVGLETFPSGINAGKYGHIEVGGKATSDYTSGSIFDKEIDGNTAVISGKIFIGTEKIYLRIKGLGKIADADAVTLKITVVPTVTAEGPAYFNSVFSLHDVPVQRSNYPNWDLINDSTYQNIDTFNKAIVLPGATGTVSYTIPESHGWTNGLIFNVKVPVTSPDGTTNGTASVEVRVGVDGSTGEHQTTFDHATLLQNLIDTYYTVGGDKYKPGTAYKNQYDSTNGYIFQPLPDDYVIQCSSILWQSEVETAITGFDVIIVEESIDPSRIITLYENRNGVKPVDGVPWGSFSLFDWSGYSAIERKELVQSLINNGGAKVRLTCSGETSGYWLGQTGSSTPELQFNWDSVNKKEIQTLSTLSTTNGGMYAISSIDDLVKAYTDAGKDISTVDNLLIQNGLDNFKLYKIEIILPEVTETPVMIRSIFKDKIALEYKVDLPSTVTNPVMQFTVNDVTTYVYGSTTPYGEEPMPMPFAETDTTTWYFVFAGVIPADLAAPITARVVDSSVEIPTVSVLDYCAGRLSGSADTTFKQLISELVRYASSANKLNGGEGITADGMLNVAAGTAYTNRFNNTGDAWKGATLVLNNTITMRLYWNGDVAPELANVAALGHTVKINTEKKCVEISGFTPLDYDDVVTAKIGDSTITYSVGSYIERMSVYSESTEITKEICTCLRNYGRAAEAYAAATKQN